MTPSVAAAAWASWEEFGKGNRIAAGDGDVAADALGTIPLATFVEMTERVARLRNAPALGWIVGERHDLGTLGELGGAVLACSSLGTALRRLVHYFSLLQDVTEFELREEEDHCLVSYRILDPDIWPRQQDALFTLAIIGQLMRLAVGLMWSDLEFLIESDDPLVAAEVSRHTGSACFGGSDANVIRFPRRFLDLPMRREHSSPAYSQGRLARSLVQKRRGTSVEMRVRTSIYQHLGNRAIRQEDVAAELGMSSRTLRRRLAGDDLSFQHIVDECRMRQAAHEFRRCGRVSLAQTALRLGYSEHSTFTRAFARWSGVPPQSYIRAGLGAAAADA